MKPGSCAAVGGRQNPSVRFRSLPLRSESLALLGTILLLAGCARDSALPEVPARPDLSAFPAGLTRAVDAAEAALRASPSDRALWLQLGRLHHANGFTAPARGCYLAAANDPALAARACYYLAQLAQTDGDPAGQRHWLEETLRHDPAYAPAHRLLAATALKSGDTATASAEFEAALKLVPDDAVALLGLARLRLQEGNTAAAATMLENLIAKHPRSSAGPALLAQVVAKQGDEARAAVLRDQARLRKDPPPSDPWMDEMMALSYDVQRVGMRFEDFVKSGMTDEASRMLRQLESIDPDNWIVCEMRALAAQQQGRGADAVREYERALASGGNAAKIYPALVVSLLAEKRYADAEKTARAALQAIGDTAELLVALAEARRLQGDASEARTLLQRALIVAPEDVPANFALARLAWEAGHRDAAVPYLETIRAASASEVSSRALLGQYHLEGNNPAAALAALTEAYASEPANTAVGDMLALAHLRTGNRIAQAGRLADALPHYAAARAVRPAMAEVHANEVQVLMQQRDFPAAEAAMLRLVALRPDNAAVFVSLGDIQNSAGRPAAARESWQRARELAGDEGDPKLLAALRERLRNDDATP